MFREIIRWGQRTAKIAGGTAKAQLQSKPSGRLQQHFAVPMRPNADHVEVIGIQLGKRGQGIEAVVQKGHRVSLQAHAREDGNDGRRRRRGNLSGGRYERRVKEWWWCSPPPPTAGVAIHDRHGGCGWCP